MLSKYVAASRLIVDSIQSFISKSHNVGILNTFTGWKWFQWFSCCTRFLEYGRTQKKLPPTSIANTLFQGRNSCLGQERMFHAQGTIDVFVCFVHIKRVLTKLKLWLFPHGRSGLILLTIIQMKHSDYGSLCNLQCNSIITCVREAEEHKYIAQQYSVNSREFIL